MCIVGFILPVFTILLIQILVEVTHFSYIEANFSLLKCFWCVEFLAVRVSEARTVSLLLETGMWHVTNDKSLRSILGRHGMVCEEHNFSVSLGPSRN